MSSQSSSRSLAADAWVTFPGGELEGRRPRVMYPACRHRAGGAGTLCFQCYRSGLDRERALKRAADLHTASEARFQTTLPFEPVDRPRLERLKVERAAVRNADLQTPSGGFIDRRRRAQIAARHAVESFVAAGKLDVALHAAELQLPESWLPFVVAR